MIVGIDANEANIKNRVGSNEYSFQLLWHLKREAENKRLKAQFRIYLKRSPLSDLPKKENWWQYKVLKPAFLWTQWRLPLELFFGAEKPDIFFSLSHYAPRFCPIPLIISIMDLAFLRYPKQFKVLDLYQLINWTKYSIRKASHVLTISQFTKKEIIHFYKYPENKITIVYPGIKKLPVTQTFKLQAEYGTEGNYFLFVGTLQPRKNLIRLIEAFSKITKILKYKDLKLIIVGRKGWLYENIFNRVKELNLQNKVIFTGFISEEEKIVLFRNALAFILPSLYEGFGIPVLEAMQQKCPIIVSKTSSLPEIAGEAAIYIADPFSVDSIYQAMIKMVKLNRKQKKRMIEKGISQVKKFKWSKIIKNVIELLTNLS